MDDDEGQAQSESRPATAHRVATDESFDDSEQLAWNESFDDIRAHAQPPKDTTNSNTHPKMTAANIPDLPPPPETEDLTYLKSPSMDAGNISDSQHEWAVRQHLQDMESSFSAPLSPIPTSNNGYDDTYLFDSPTKKAVALPLPESPIQELDEFDDESQSQQQESTTPQPSTSHGAEVADASHPSIVTTDHDGTYESSNTSALEAFSSSPTAAAAARTVSRTVLGANQRRDESQRREPSMKQSSDDGHRDADTSADSSQQLSVGGLKHSTSNQSLNRSLADSVGNTPGYALRVVERPKYLQRRGTSQRSSISSIATDQGSEATVGLGADYALQSGGALPSNMTLSRSSSNMLSRTVSMGSMASGIEDLPDDSTTPLGYRNLETLPESPQRTTHGPRDEDQDQDRMQTPKPKQRTSLSAPTDTVIARHVRNVQVPESLAREYKTKSGLQTPRKPSDFSTVSGTGTHTSRHGGRNLTLKEQSSTIERLSKENFDLKLKVMFLSDRLDKISDENVRNALKENAEMKIAVVKLQTECKHYRKRIRELEKQSRNNEHERPGTAESRGSDEESAAAHDQEAQEREEELWHLRERVEEYESYIETLRNESLQKEAEMRRMAEVVKNFSKSERTGESIGRDEETAVWQDLLDQETARREQADEDNRRLREEIFRLKQDVTTLGGGLHHTTNIYNITKKPRDQSNMSPTRGTASRPVSAFSNEIDQHNGGSMSAASTLVDELRRESEQLRHENAELRREVGAQTSMLTSRNREKERLYQEIEDLKMAQRRGGPAPSTVDSILERSASRAGIHARSQSRGSAGTRATGMIRDDPEREELEAKMAEMRDKNNELKLQNQDLQRELEEYVAECEALAGDKQDLANTVAQMQADINNAQEDLVTLQHERDEVLQENGALEAVVEEWKEKFLGIEEEANAELDAMEEELKIHQEHIQKLDLDLRDKTESFNALQAEMRKMSDQLLGLEDQQNEKQRLIQQLTQQLDDANREMEDLENKLLEANDKAQRLSVQQESSQGEIAFLREEQEGDKIRIGDLEAALANLEESLRDEKDRVRDLDHQLDTERRQREIVANREKEEVQQHLNDLNRQMSSAKDEARTLRKNLTSREVEVAEWKERLLGLEDNLRVALGDLNGTRSTFFKDISRLQQDVENTSRELDQTKAALMEKERIIKQRDALLESHGLESRKLVEMLDKERQAHRNTKHQYETFQKTHQHVSRTVTSQDTRIVELENAKDKDKRRIAQLEMAFKDQLTERNNLLLQLWTRLSSLCGTDWAHDNSLINGRALPSLETVNTMLPGFSKNLLAAVKTIESMLASFNGKIKYVEQDLWRDYQTLEGHLEQRTKKLDRLEAVVRNGVATGSLGNSGELQSRQARLEEAYRKLKVENQTLRAAAEVRARSMRSSSSNYDLDVHGEIGSPSPSVPMGPSNKLRVASSTNSSSHGTSRIPHSNSGNRSVSSSSTRPGTTSRPQNNELVLAEDPHNSQTQPSDKDKVWMLRLRDMETKLLKEREERSQDRHNAAKRLQEQEETAAKMKEELRREKERAAWAAQQQAGR